jgi:hypothetical protein
MINENKSQRCPNCKNDRIKIIHNYSKQDVYEEKISIFFNKLSTKKRSWLVCKNCNFHFSNYLLFKKDVMKKIYKKLYRNITPKNIHNFEKFLKLPLKKSMNKQRVMFLKKNINELYNKKILKFRSGNHLDIGGGSGIFSIIFRDKDWKSQVLDITNQNLLTIKHKVRYYTKDVLKLKKPLHNRKYNLITIIDTLEHVKNFSKFLINIKKYILNRKGLIFIDCPGNFNFKRKKMSNDIFNSCHYSMWCASSFSLLANKLGFEVLKYAISHEEKDFYSFKALIINK